KSEFEAVVFALIYTVIINALVKSLPFNEALCSVVFAMILGFLWAFLYNNDIIHTLLRLLRITKKTSYPSEWYGTFSATETYIVLELKDERRIMGYPLEWPNNPQQGHFVLENAEWLIDKDGKSATIPLPTVSKILIDAANVEMVEFIKFDDKLEGAQNEC
ncbi:DUF6338 family protein, partial [Treponema endosymbiont of Eucomonympha sp.]